MFLKEGGRYIKKNIFAFLGVSFVKYIHVFLIGWNMSPLQYRTIVIEHIVDRYHLVELASAVKTLVIGAFNCLFTATRDVDKSDTDTMSTFGSISW